MKKIKRRRRFNRHLPEYVSPTTDRHGRVRLRYRRAGMKPYYFRAELGTDEFLAELHACQQQQVEPGEDRLIPGSIAALVGRYVSVPTRLGPTEATQRKIRGILDKFRDEYGTGMVRDVRFDHIDDIIAQKQQRRLVGSRMVGGPEAAKKLRKELVRMFDFAVKIEWISKNPVNEADRVKVKAGTFHTWTEGEITQYRDHHAIGTKARLAMELMLWTGQRRIDAIRMKADDIKTGRILVVQSKGNKPMMIPVAPQLLSAITAMPPIASDEPFLKTEWGKPFTNAGFGNWFRDQCDAAGLPQCSAHGLRKAIMRRMAELGLAQQTLKSVSGHVRDEEVRIYTQAADQQRMADDAIAKLADWERLTLASNWVSGKLKPAENGDKP